MGERIPICLQCWVNNDAYFVKHAKEVQGAIQNSSFNAAVVIEPCEVHKNLPINRSAAMALDSKHERREYIHRATLKPWMPAYYPPSIDDWSV